MSAPFSIPLVTPKGVLPGFISNDTFGLRGAMSIDECNRHFAGQISQANLILFLLILCLVILVLFCEYFLRKRNAAEKEVMRLKNEVQTLREGVKRAESKDNLQRMPDGVQVRQEEKPS